MDGKFRYFTILRPLALDNAAGGSETAYELGDVLGQRICRVARFVPSIVRLMTRTAAKMTGACQAERRDEFSRRLGGAIKRLVVYPRCRGLRG